jgi:endonuclease IV
VEEIRNIISETCLGFCLDFRHATCYAAFKRKDYRDVLLSFLEIEPRLFHLSDGYVDSVHDQHLHLGKGNTDLRWVLQREALKDASITIETERNSDQGLGEFVCDVEYVRRLARGDA